MLQVLQPNGDLLLEEELNSQMAQLLQLQADGEPFSEDLEMDLECLVLLKVLQELQVLLFPHLNLLLRFILEREQIRLQNSKQVKDFVGIQLVSLKSSGNLHRLHPAK